MEVIYKLKMFLHIIFRNGGCTVFYFGHNDVQIAHDTLLIQTLQTENSFWH